MSDQINELKNIFEYEIKRKLAQRARSTADEFRILMNGFKFYDYDYTGKVNQTEFVKGILRTGLSGFNESDIRSVFSCYDINNTGYVDYKNFCDYLYGREPLKPLINSQNDVKNEKNDITNEKLNQRKKTPITNNQRKTPINQNVNINNNNNNNENQNIPGNQNQIQQAQAQVEQSQQNIDTAQTKEYFQKLIFSFKALINTNNGLTYYSLLFELKNASDQNKQISLDNFVNAFKAIGLNIPQNDIINFFNLLDFSGTGKISIDDVMNTLVDPMNEHRKLYVVNKFAKMDVEKQGEVKVSLLKEKFNPKGHPDVMSGKTNDEEIFKQFCYTLDIYCNIRMIDDIINYKQFIDYYDGISSSIHDEKYFEDILNVWDDLTTNNMEINSNNIENNLQQEVNNNMNNNNNNMNTNSNNNMNKNTNNNMGNNMKDILNMGNNEENRNIINNNVEIQNANNNRYNNQQNARPEKPNNNNFNSSFCDENIGINSLFLGEPSHVVPKSFAKRNFRRQRADFNELQNDNNNNMQYQNKQRRIINNNRSSELLQNNNLDIFNRNTIDTVKKTPINQSQAIKINQKDLNQNKNDINQNYNTIMNNDRQKKVKMTYNPITNEYTPINIVNNNNNMERNRNRNRNATPLNPINLSNQNNININNNSEVTTNNTTFNNPKNNNNENQINDIVMNSLDKLKNSLIFRGTRLLFSFQRKLSLYDLNHQGLVTLNNFLKIAQAYTINLSEEEAKIIFDLFDKDKKGVINYNEFMQTIVGPINTNRQTIIEKVFDFFNKDSNGKVSLNEIRVLFNPRGHPDVMNGKRSEGEILGEFLDNIESFKEYLENLTGNYDNSFSLDDFVSFYNEVGIGIEDDKKFEFMIYNCWNLNKNVGNNMSDLNNIGGSKYRNNNRGGFRGNNGGNLMSRAGSEIINNIGY